MKLSNGTLRCLMNAAIREAMSEFCARLHTSEEPTEDHVKALLLSEVRLKKGEFDKLSDYSCTLPTGTVIGKQWKRRYDYYDASKGWCLGQYVESDEPGMVDIWWRHIVVV